jgi:hypothetical protein
MKPAMLTRTFGGAMLALWLGGKAVQAETAGGASPLTSTEETYRVHTRAPLFDGPNGPALKDLFADTGSCVSINLAGPHTDTKFRVTISGKMPRAGENIIGDVYIEGKNVSPLGPYNWDKGCNAILIDEAKPKPPKQEEKKPSGSKETKPAERELRNNPSIAFALGASSGIFWTTNIDLNLHKQLKPGAKTIDLPADSCLMQLGKGELQKGFVPVLAMNGKGRFETGYVLKNHLTRAPEKTNYANCIAALN